MVSDPDPAFTGGVFLLPFPKIHMEAMAVQWNVDKADAGLKKI